MKKLCLSCCLIAIGLPWCASAALRPGLNYGTVGGWNTTAYPSVTNSCAGVEVVTSSANW